MRSHPYDHYEQEQDDLLRYGLEHNEYGELVREIELADRIADQASLPPGHPLARAAARHRLGRGPSPYEDPGELPPGPCLAPGEEVTYRGEDGAGPTRRGTVRRLIDEDGVAVVAFHGGGVTAVSAEALERRAA